MSPGCVTAVAVAVDAEYYALPSEARLCCLGHKMKAWLHDASAEVKSMETAQPNFSEVAQW